MNHLLSRLLVSLRLLFLFKDELCFLLRRKCLVSNAFGVVVLWVLGRNANRMVVVVKRRLVVSHVQEHISAIEQNGGIVSILLNGLVEVLHCQFKTIDVIVREPSVVEVNAAWVVRDCLCKVTQTILELSFLE